jgi:cellulose synthase/poly-beta-1,6-N-acetylglucosamine synthase-like glycosyltransferase
MQPQTKMRKMAWATGTLACIAALLVPFPLASAPLAGLGIALLLAGRLTQPTARALSLCSAAGVALALLAPSPLARALAVASAGVLLHTLGRSASRNPVLTALACGLVGIAAALFLAGWPLAEGLLVGTCGLGLLALQAQWGQAAARPEAAGWEPVVSLTVLLASVYSLLAYVAGLGWFTFLPPAVESDGVLLAAGLAVLLVLTAPFAAPGPLRRVRGTVLDAAFQASVTMAVLNALFLSLSVLSLWSLAAARGLLLLWQLFVVAMEYRTIRHAQRRARPTPGREPPRSAEPVTVIVPAAGEGQLLAETVRRNLAVDHPLKFILVVAGGPNDETVRVAQGLARRHPRQVRTLLGNTGSKAGDLNLAWAQATTDAVLVLDADETIDRDSLLHGLAALRSAPDVGIVQGRKVSRAPDDGFLARLVSAERRYSTWMDQAMHGEQLGSAHFAGSAALLRREVPGRVGGWTDRTMTEDIEFTLRLHLDGAWRIVYAADMVVRESDPKTFPDLVRQRSRWARGWAQCVHLYLGDVWKARGRLGRRRSFGLLLLLLLAVSAFWATLVPVAMMFRLGNPVLPLFVGIAISAVLLPSRLLAYGYAALKDPVIPLPRTPLRLAELALHAYLWVLVGWFVQLHALYLELARASPERYVTVKRHPGQPAPASAAG